MASAVVRTQPELRTPDLWGKDRQSPAPPRSPPSQRSPSPQISPLPAGGGCRSTTPHQLRVPEPRRGLEAAQEARRPLPPALPGSPPPALWRAGGRRHSAPDSPHPRAVLSLAQGAGFLEEISRKSAGPLASGSPPNPAGARSSAAPLAAPGESRGGGAGSPLYRPSSPHTQPRGEGGVALGVAAEGGPLAQRPDKHLSPSPYHGHPRVSHSWTSGSGWRRER